jgi:uncharacterized protein (DUF433 family)
MTAVIDIVHSDPDILGGTPVFVGTRVPVRNLFDYLALSDLDEFLRQFPSVTRDRALAAIRQAESAFLSYLEKKCLPSATAPA